MKIKLFSKAEKITTVLEIGKKWLKIVQLKQHKDQKSICCLDAFEVASLSEDEIVKKFNNLEVKAKVNSERLLLMIPHGAASTKNLNLPSTNPAEIEDMVDLQISKQTPYSSDDIIKDYHLLEGRYGGYSRVLLVIVHNDVVQRCFKIIEKARLQAERIGFGSEGFLKWALFQRKQDFTDIKSVVLIDIDYDSVDFEAIAEKEIIFSRSFSLASSDLTESEQDWQNKFIEEVARSIYAYQNEITDKELGKIVVSVPEFAKHRLDPELLKGKLGLPVEIINQLNRVNISSQAAKKYNSLSEKNLSFAALIGAAFDFNKLAIDLVPQEVKVERSFKERGKDIYRIGMIAIFILIILTSIFLGRLYNKEHYLNQLESRLSEVRDKAESLSKKMDKIALVKEREYTGNFSLELIYSIHQSVPPEVYLAELVFDQQENIILRGNAATMADVFGFVSNLEAVDYFKNVQTRYTGEQVEEGVEVISFEVLCPLNQEYKGFAKHQL